MTPKTSKSKYLFALLWLAGFIGELSVLWVTLPIPEGITLPIPIPLLKLLSLLQSLVILSVAVFAGTALAHKVGLSAPFAEAVSHKLFVQKASALRNAATLSPVSGLTPPIQSTHPSPRPITALRRQLIPGAIGGAAGVGLSLSWFLLMKPLLPADFLAASQQAVIPLLTRLLKGGIAEELVLRWGVMTLLVWLMWRLLQKRQGAPKTIWFVIAIVLSALLFGLLHLPAVSMLTANITSTLVIYIIIGNALFGPIAGFLYWKVGLESAIIAHMFFHLLLFIVQAVSPSLGA